MEGVFTAIERAALPKQRATLISPLHLRRFRNRDRIIKHRAYGLRNEDYLRLKVLFCMLPTPCSVAARYNGPRCAALQKGFHHSTDDNGAAEGWNDDLRDDPANGLLALRLARSPALVFPSGDVWRELGYLDFFCIGHLRI
jgi:hypothetical protein